MSGGPKASATLSDRVADGVGKHGEHSRYIKYPVHQLTGVLREDPRSLVQFGSKMGSDAGPPWEDC
jgi:hypothetical protein